LGIDWQWTVDCVQYETASGFLEVFSYQFSVITSSSIPQPIAYSLKPKASSLEKSLYFYKRSHGILWANMK